MSLPSIGGICNLNLCKSLFINSVEYSNGPWSIKVGNSEKKITQICTSTLVIVHSALKKKQLGALNLMCARVKTPTISI